MQEPFQAAPPIPSPIETPFTNSVPQDQEPRIWKNAPQIVKSVALLAFLAIAFLPLAIIFMIYALTESGSSRMDTFTTVLTIVVLFITWIVSIWQRFALKKGTKAAWTVQLVLSIMGLTSFPIGTLIHGYVLSQWFKPETKAWFGVQ